ncbi:hypothetical protein TNCV_54731 [Trichonephila clavipes]|nr:hypothetical protein TNCV_54731 [Trichonephila clavipes]
MTVTSRAPGFWRDGVENKMERTRISGGAPSQNCSKDVTSRRSWRPNWDCPSTVESRKLGIPYPGRLDSRPHPCKVSDAELTDAAASNEKMPLE